MNFFDEVTRITDLYAAGVRAGAGLPPLKAAAGQTEACVQTPPPSSADLSAPAAAPDPASELYRLILKRDHDFYDHDDDYKRHDYESRHAPISNHDMTRDQRLDDPRRGQAKDINRERP